MRYQLRPAILTGTFRTNSKTVTMYLVWGSWFSRKAAVKPAIPEPTIATVIGRLKSMNQVQVQKCL